VIPCLTYRIYTVSIYRKQIYTVYGIYIYIFIYIYIYILWQPCRCGYSRQQSATVEAWLWAAKDARVAYAEIVGRGCVFCPTSTWLTNKRCWVCLLWMWVCVCACVRGQIMLVYLHTWCTLSDWGAEVRVFLCLDICSCYYTYYVGYHEFRKKKKYVGSEKPLPTLI